MKTDILQFLFVCKGFLGITLPVEIRIKPKAPRAVNDATAICETRERKGKVIRFVIFVYHAECMQSEYSLIDVIAHELVHAKMIEHGVFNEKHHHDKRFQKLCKLLESKMPAFGYKLGELYNPKTDTD